MNKTHLLKDKKYVPKVLHYCWFSGEAIPDNYIYYLKTWQEKCPDYEIKQWDSNNFEIDNVFAKEAYLSKKWAFVTDYARLKILYENGGIYLDLDVELLKSFDDLLKYKFFMGLETDSDIATCVIGSEPHNEIIGNLLEYYDDVRFINNDGTFNQITNVQIVTKQITERYGLQLSNNITYIDGSSVILSKDYFSPKDYFTGITKITEDTHSIHHFGESWKDTKDVLRGKKVHEIYEQMNIFQSKYPYVNKLIYRVLVVYANYSLYGIKDTLNFIIERLRLQL